MSESHLESDETGTLEPDGDAEIEYWVYYGKGPTGKAPVVATFPEKEPAIAWCEEHCYSYEYLGRDPFPWQPTSDTGYIAEVWRF